MATNYLMIHTSYKHLAEDAKTLVDEYQKKEISEERLQEVLLAWDTNCPNILYENEQRNSLPKSIVRVIGKRRTAVILAALKSAKK